MSNATKAQVIAAVNSALALLVSFGVSLTDTQTAAISVAVNSLLGLWIALTYGNSAKRIPDS